MTAVDPREAPGSLAVDHAVYVLSDQHITALIRLQFPLIDQGDYVNAEALDQATQPPSRQIEAFARANGLAACP